MTNLYAITMPSITWNKTVWLHVTLNPCPPLLQDPTSVPACCCTYLFVVFTLNLLGAYCWSDSSNRWRCRPYSTTQGVVFQSCIANFLIYIQATDKEICVHPGWLVFTCVSLGCRPSCILTVSLVGLVSCEGPVAGWEYLPLASPCVLYASLCKTTVCVP